MKTNYEKQAMDFLEKTGCKMTITYKENRVDLLLNEFLSKVTH